MYPSAGLSNKSKTPTVVVKKNNGTGVAGALGPLYNSFGQKDTGPSTTPALAPQVRNTTQTQPQAPKTNTVATTASTSYSAPAASTPSYSEPAASTQNYSAPQTDYMQSYINQMQEAIQAAQRQAEEAQRRAEEQLKAAQEAQRKAREEAYQRSAAQQKTDYEYGQGQLNSATDAALQQAYINNMMGRRNLDQQLAAQGLNGGVSESTIAGMLNNYNNSRNALETERQSQLASLLNTYQNNKAQLENQRASGDAADLSQYQTNLSNLVANNANNLVSLMQGYANMAASMPQLRRTFNTTTGQWEYAYA